MTPVYSVKQPNSLQQALIGECQCEHCYSSTRICYNNTIRIIPITCTELCVHKASSHASDRI